MSLSKQPFNKSTEDANNILFAKDSKKSRINYYSKLMPCPRRGQHAGGVAEP